MTQHTEMRIPLIAPTASHTGGSVVGEPKTDAATIGLILRRLADDQGVDAIICAVNRLRRVGIFAAALDAVIREHLGVALVPGTTLLARAPGPRQA